MESFEITSELLAWVDVSIEKRGQIPEAVSYRCYDSSP